MRNSILGTPIELFTRMMFSRVIERLAVVISQESLSFSQVAALHIIDQGQTVSIQEISTRLNLSLSATSRLIDDLVRADFVDREEDQENRRSKLLTLTATGRAFMNTLSIERVKMIEQTATTLPQEISRKFLAAVSMNLGKKK